MRKKKVDERKIVFERLYDDRTRWKTDISDIIYNLAYKYNFWYTPTVVTIKEGGDFNTFVEKVKKNSLKHNHKMIMYKILYPEHFGTIYSDMYCLVIFTNNFIQFIAMSEQYSLSTKYNARNKTANTFLKAFDKAFEQAAADRMEEDLLE